MISDSYPFIPIGELVEFNPKPNGTLNMPENSLVQFLPMKLVEEKSGKIHLTELKQLSEVKKGYTFFKEGDVLFAKVTPCMENGKIAVVQNLHNGIGFGSTEFHVLRPTKKLYNKYLFYFILQDRFRKEAEAAMTGAVGLRRVPKQFIEQYKIPLPPFEVQIKKVTKIEELFSELDKGIESLRLAQQQLKVYRQSLLKWAFEGRLTNEEVKEGELPEGWKWERLKNLVSILGDGLHGTPKYTDKGAYYFINGNNLSNGRIVFKEATKRVSKTEFEKYQKPLNAKTILVSINGTLGNTAFYNNENVILGKSACFFNVLETVNKYYIRYILLSQRFINYAIETATGSTIPNVSLKAMREFDIPLAPIEEQKIIVQEIEFRLSLADKMEESINQSLQQSEAMRQSILKYILTDN